MASTRYIQQKRKRNSDRGKYGNTVKAQRRIANAEQMRVVGGVITYGIFGEHHIEFLSDGHETHGYVRCNGELRRPQTPRGFVSILGRWLWRKKTNASTQQIQKTESTR